MQASACVLWTWSAIALCWHATTDAWLSIEVSTVSAGIVMRLDGINDAFGRRECVPARRSSPERFARFSRMVERFVGRVARSGFIHGVNPERDRTWGRTTDTTHAPRGAALLRESLVCAHQSDLRQLLKE